LLLFYQQQLVYNSVVAMALSSRVQWMQQQQQQQWWARVWCHVWEWSQLGMHQTPKQIVEMLALIRVLAQLNFRAWVTSMVVAACIHIWMQQIIKPSLAVTYSCSGSCTMTICSNTFP
jgi:muconolactone delta-isomerase